MENREGVASDAEWEVWYQDTFDRECPRRVDVVGRGLVAGLIELWSRHLFETVQAGGGRGFGRFNLWWKQAGRSVEVAGDWEAQVRLRDWIFCGVEERSVGNGVLLRQIAVAHARYLQRGKTSEAILAAAAGSQTREDFEERLQSLA